MRTILVVVLALLAIAPGVTGCGDELSDPDTFCCAIEKVNDHCDYSDGELKKIAEAGDGDACRFMLEEYDLGCGDMWEDEAIADCVDD